jgi:predicted ferric reductase
MPIAKKLKSYIGLLVLVLLILLPVFILSQSLPLAKLFSPWPVLFGTLGKLTGLIGLAAFSFSLLLASRFVWLDRLFHGLPRVLNVHRWLGVISFVFIIFHPLFLAARFLPVSSQAAWLIFSFWGNAAYLFGYIAMLIFMGLILMTFLWRLRYERLKSLHSLLSVPLMIGGIHGLLIDSDIKRIPWLAAYFIILISVSVVAYLLRLALVHYGIKAKAYSILAIGHSSKNSIKVTLAPDKKAIEMKPGQFIFVSFPDIKKGEEHPFSVAEINSDGSIAIVAKILGDYTKKMDSLEKGFKAYVDGPYGSFGDGISINERQVWIAGGIGITPFLSMARDFTSCPTQNAKVDLFYVVSSLDDLAEADSLKKMSAACPNFNLTTYISDKEGRFDLEKLRSMAKDLKSCQFYICGPAGMIEYFVSVLRKENIPKNCINIEAFKLL